MVEKIPKRRAFSLVEMLVVLAVVGVLFAFSTPMWMSQSSVDLNGASLRLAGFFEEARAEAVAWGEPVRVLVHDDASEPEKYRRRIIAVRKETEAGDLSAESWVSVLHPMLMPEGIFFSPPDPGSAANTMFHKEPGAGEEAWRYYEIAASGAMRSDERNVVLGRGILTEPSNQVRIPNPENVAGFRLSDRTKPIHFRTRDDIIEDVR